MIAPPRHTVAALESARLVAITAFRQERLQEPVEQYHERLDEYLGLFEELLEATVDLRELADRTLDLLADRRMEPVLRYLTGPPISADDLATLAEVTSLIPSSLANTPGAVDRVAGVIRDALDRRRFAWVSEGREPEEHERRTAVLASAALLAAQRVQTARRHDAKRAQEDGVAEALRACGWAEVPPREVRTLRSAPAAGEFCREALLAGRKADFIIGLHDGRILALECKVSNSALNSVKRLNNDAAAKAAEWLRLLGSAQVVPAAVISGVYKLGNLMAAQEQGLALFWAHEISTLTDWIAAARP